MNKKRKDLQKINLDLFEEELLTIDKKKRPDLKKEKGKMASPKMEVYSVNKETSLLEFLFEVMSNRSKTTVKSYLAHQQITVNEKTVTQFNYRLNPGDKVSLYRGIVQKAFRHPMLSIIYEDKYLLVVHKKNGLLSMATDKERKKTAYYILSEYLKQQDSSNRIFIIHRLDRETSGIMLFAKTLEVQHQLQKNWNNLVLEREYVAVVSGRPPQKEGTYRSFLAENKAYMVYSVPNFEMGELAVTHYRILKQSPENTLLALNLETGKKNQIRVHMKDMGCPIIGDKKYGGIISPINRIALHARSIRFIHPVTKQEMFFDTDIPKPFLQLLK